MKWIGQENEEVPRGSSLGSRAGRGSVSTPSSFADSVNQTPSSNPFGISSGQTPTLFGALTNLLNAWSGEHMTNAEVERNQMQMQNQEDIYQRQVTGMQNAGLNPALMYQSGAQSAPSAPATSTPGMNMSDIMSLITLKPTIENIKSQSQRNRDEGKAALINALSGQRNAGANEMNAETNRMRQEVDAWLAKSQISLNEAQIDKLAADTAQVNLFCQQLPERLELLRQQVGAQQSQAVAALQSSIAALRQAAVAEKLSDAEIAFKESQTILNWAVKEGYDIVNRHLDAKTMAEIKELQKRGDFLDASAKNLDRNAKVQWAETIGRYVGSAAQITSSVMSVVSGMPVKAAPIEF